MVKRFGAGFICGYLLGARTGRERYDQLAEAGRKLMDAPMVRDVIGSAGDGARDVVRRLTGAIEEAVHGTGDADEDRDETGRATNGGERASEGEARDGNDGEPEDVDGFTTETDGSARQSARRDRARPRAREGREHPRPRPGTERGPQRRRSRAEGERRSTRGAEGGGDQKALGEGQRAKGSRAGRARPEKGGRSGLARAAASALERGRTD